MQISLIFAGLFLFIFYSTYDSPVSLAISSFFLNCCIGSIEVLVNVCLMTVGKANVKFNTSFSYGVYGMGGMFGPILVSFLGIDSLLVLFIWLVILGVSYFGINCHAKSVHL